jgi:sugar phosphate isomerase/epimerase
MSETEPVSPSIHKNLNASSLGIVARQSELNELALTYGFQGLDIDMADVAQRAAKHGLKEATQFLHLPVGQFELPISLAGDDAQFAKELEALKAVLEVAKSAKASRCLQTLESTSNELPYHENFERHRTRIGQVATLLDEHGMQFGLGLSGAVAERGDGQFQFIQQADDLLAFIETLSASNVGLALDTWNWHLAGGTSEQIEKIGAGKIVSVQVADISPEADLDTIDSTQREFPTADGLAKIADVFKTLVSLQYNGPVTLAPSPLKSSGSKDHIVRNAAKVLDELWDPKPVVEETPGEENEQDTTVASAT